MLASLFAAPADDRPPQASGRRADRVAAAWGLSAAMSVQPRAGCAKLRTVIAQESTLAANQAAFACAPPWTEAGVHAMSPRATHDEIARFNFLANLNKYLANAVVGGNRLAYERRAKPRFEREHAHAPRDRREVRAAMAEDAYYQMWSSIRRNAMEMRQQAGRSLVLRQAAELRDRARALNANAASLVLDASVPVPRYQSAVDNHCMPGSYYTELMRDDVSAAANYDAGMFATTTGLFGRYLDGAGRGIVDWLANVHRNFAPRRVLDLGCGLGHNTVPLAQAFPRAQVIGVDVAAPMLRYGHARACGMGVTNLEFRQASAESLAFPESHFDLIVSTMFLHETSYRALRNILRECSRLLARGGIQLHLEQPPYRSMDIFEQFMRDWDCYNNNEPFWTTVHDTDMMALMAECGCADDRRFETEIHAIVDLAMPKVSESKEDFGRGGMWYAFGAVRAA